MKPISTKDLQKEVESQVPVSAYDYLWGYLLHDKVNHDGSLIVLQRLLRATDIALCASYGQVSVDVKSEGKIGVYASKALTEAIEMLAKENKVEKLSTDGSQFRIGYDLEKAKVEYEQLTKFRKTLAYNVDVVYTMITDKKTVEMSRLVETYFGDVLMH